MFHVLLPHLLRFISFGPIIIHKQSQSVFCLLRQQLDGACLHCHSRQHHAFSCHQSWQSRLFIRGSKAKPNSVGASTLLTLKASVPCRQVLLRTVTALVHQHQGAHRHVHTIIDTALRCLPSLCELGLTIHLTQTLVSGIRRSPLILLESVQLKYFLNFVMTYW